MAEKVASDITHRYSGVEYDGSSPPQVQPPSTKGGKITGIAEDSASSGDTVSVKREFGEQYQIKAGEAISEGDFIAADTDGRGIVADEEMYAFAVALHDMETDEIGQMLYIGDAPVEGLLSATVGSESSDTIPVTFQTLDGAQKKLLVGLYEDQGGDTGFSLVSDASATGQDLTVGSDGTATTSGGGKQLIAQTNASGALDIDVNDNTGSLSGDRWVKAETLDGDRMYLIKVTFA